MYVIIADMKMTYLKHVYIYLYIYIYSFKIIYYFKFNTIGIGLIIVLFYLNNRILKNKVRNVHKLYIYHNSATFIK